MYHCDSCGKEIKNKYSSHECFRVLNANSETIVCRKCADDDFIWDLARNGKLPQWKAPTGAEMPTIPLIKDFNEPVHYHKHEVDTIEFLQKGFPPEVFRGFAIGSIIKYLHRAQEKNGLEDYLKAEDYTKRLFQFEKDLNHK